MPPRQPNLEERLLVEAAALIASHGIEALSLRELGRRAGVSRAAPYHYFPDKAALVAEVGALGFARLRDRIAGAAAHAATPRDRLRAGLLAYIRFATDDEHFFQLMFSGLLERGATTLLADQPGPPIPFSSDAAREAFDLLLDFVRAAAKSGKTWHGDPLLIAHAFWCYTHGVAALARGDQLKHLGGVEVVFDVGFDALVARLLPLE